MRARYPRPLDDGTRIRLHYQIQRPPHQPSSAKDRSAATDCRSKATILGHWERFAFLGETNCVRFSGTMGPMCWDIMTNSACPIKGLEVGSGNSIMHDAERRNVTESHFRLRSASQGTGAQSLSGSSSQTNSPQGEYAWTLALHHHSAAGLSFASFLGRDAMTSFAAASASIRSS